MALTKLMHMKQCGKGNPARHLKNGIAYIMQDKKTDHGRWIGGNAGSTWQEVYQTMLETKQEFRKQNGRQGYHFVISFKEEAAPEEVYKVLENFCREYLGENYDYVFSVHTDSTHIHGHIIFNSVSRTDGLKYHYTKGDWEKYIQPVTDKICSKYGFEKFEYEGGESRDYGEWKREQEGKRTWREQIRRDIDSLIPEVKNTDELCRRLIGMGYHVRKGNSREKGEYLTLRPEGGRKAIRTKSLGKGYMLKDLELRIKSSQAKVEGDRSFQAPKIKSAYVPGNSNIERRTFYPSSYQFYYVRKYCENTVLYQYQNTRNYRDIRETEELAEACRYLLRNQIRSETDLNSRKEALHGRILGLEAQKGTLYQDLLTGDGQKILQAYEDLESKRSQAERDYQEDLWESLDDEMSKMEKQYPVLQWKEREEKRKTDLRAINKERAALIREEKLLERIQNRESEAKEVKICRPTIVRR